MLLKTFIERYMEKTKEPGEVGITLKQGLFVDECFVKIRNNYTFFFKKNRIASEDRKGVNIFTKNEITNVSIARKLLYLSGPDTRVAIKLSLIKDFKLVVRSIDEKYIVQDKMSAYRK